MKKRFLLGVAPILVLACSLSSSAQDMGYWRAGSSSAKTVTGDITISDSKLAINFSRFTIAQIRKLQPAEALAAFDADASAGGSGNLYRLSIPASKQFSHHNTLCGSDETQWMATYAAGNNLQVAFFSGSSMPVLTAEALTNAPNLCGTFSYVR